jgi:hypothetical protein
MPLFATNSKLTGQTTICSEIIGFRNFTCKVGNGGPTWQPFKSPIYSDRRENSNLTGRSALGPLRDHSLLDPNKSGPWSYLISLGPPRPVKIHTRSRSRPSPDPPGVRGPIKIRCAPEIWQLHNTQGPVANLVGHLQRRFCQQRHRHMNTDLK